MMANNQEMQSFIAELSGFAQIAEDTLKRIEQNMDRNKSEFQIFAEKMFTIRGTAQQLNLPHIAHIAGLGEEIAQKGTVAESRAQVRKCVGSLWDTLTTVKFLLEHDPGQTGLEQKILINRLEHTLKAFGGSRPAVSQDEIEEILRKRKP